MRSAWRARAFLGISTLLLGLSSVRAETVSSQKIGENKRLVPLKKLTVGPDDQYSAAVDPSRELLVYVHKSDLVAHLVAHDLKTADEVDLLPLTGDSQEPMFGPGGELVFTYFKFNARGDICHFKPQASPLKTASDSDLSCLKRSKENSSTQRSNPFWISANELGYLERDMQSSSSQIIGEDIRSGQTRVLVSGSVWSPSMRAGGHLITYNELLGPTANQGWRMVVRDLNSKKISSVHLALPGLSGFPLLSEDEKFLYFSHFMSDSNNDRTIDGSDNAVVFRLSTEKILSAREGDQLVPEQLTSSDSSCSFPRPIGDAVYATCAFEGSLDIYSLPLTGVIPAAWALVDLKNGLQTSRSYAERILILNALKVRTPQDASIEQQLFFNHLMQDDTVAARFYLTRVKLPSSDGFVKLAMIFLEARELKKAQPVDGEVSREFRQAMLQLDQNAAKVGARSGSERFNDIVRGSIRADLQDWHEAETLLAKSRSARVAHPIERYFRFELARRVYERDLPKFLVPLTEAYRETILAPELSNESKIYYTFNWLKVLSDNQKDMRLRQAAIEKMAQGMSQPVLTLLKSELVSIKMVVLSPKEQDLAFRELGQLMIDSQHDYFLRKAQYVRSILILTQAANFKYLSTIAENWLKYTQKGDIEFSYAREVFSDASLDQAYGYLGLNKFQLADNFFYASALATDDLESHYGYITTLVRENKRASIARQYSILKNRHFIEDNMKFVDALLALIDGAPKVLKDPGSTADVDVAISKLESMTEDRDSATRHLLLGYSYMEKMLRLAVGAEFDTALFENAHRNLMLAYDLGRDNDRIRVSALMDLGILHERAQNHGLAARFFALRKSLPFEDDADRARFEWLYAHALDRSHQPEVALRELSQVVPSQVQAPIVERRAFDATLAGDFEKACGFYREVFSDPHNVQGNENLAKTNLMYGFALLRAGHAEQATTTLKRALASIRTLKPIAKDREHIVDFVPVRLQLIADGLLAQAASTTADQVAALDERAGLLVNNKKIFEGWQDDLIQTHLQLAETWRKTDIRKMKTELDLALSLAESAGRGGQFLNHSVFRTAVSYLSSAAVHPELFGPHDAVEIGKVYDGCLEAYAQQIKKVDQSQLEYQKLKLQLLWASFATHVLSRPETAPGDLDSIMASGSALKVKADLAPQWEELQALARGLKI